MPPAASRLQTLAWLVAAAAPALAYAQWRVNLPFEPPRVLHATGLSDGCVDDRPSVATDGARRWMVVWTTTANAGGAPTGRPRIACSTSTDDGRTWSDPRTVSDLCLQANHYPSPVIACDRAGRWLVAWDTTHPVPSQYTTPVSTVVCATSDDFGNSWSAPEAIVPDAGDGRWQFAPGVVFHEGAWIALWNRDALDGYSSILGGSVVASTSADGRTWSTPVELGPDIRRSTSYRSPIALLSGPHGLHAMWTVPGETSAANRYVIATSTDRGRTWSGPSTIDTGRTGAGAPALACSSTGRLLAVYAFATTPSTTRVVLARTSDDDGATWSPPTTLLRVSSDLTPTAVWVTDRWLVVMESSTSRLYQRVSTDGVDWSGAIDTTLVSQFSNSHFAAASSQSTAVGVWTSRGVPLPNPADFRGLEPDMAFRRWSPAELPTWDGMNALCEAQCADALALDWYPALDHDGRGHWNAVWSGPAGRPTTSWDATNNAVLIAGSADDGAHWSEPRVLATPAAPGRSFTQPSLASDGAAGWTAAWAEWTPDGTRVLAAASADGAATWTAAAELDVFPAGAAPNPAITPAVKAGAGGVRIVAWAAPTPQATPWPKLRFARSTDAGRTWTPASPLDPAADSRPTELDGFPRLATDGAGTWVAAWLALDRAPPLAPRYTLRYSLSLDDGRTWSRSIAPSPPVGDDIQRACMLATDRRGRWIIAWLARDATGMNYEIRAIRSDDNARAWSLPYLLAGTNGSTFGSLPADICDLCTDERGLWTLIYPDEEGPVLIRSINNGLSWSRPATVPLPPSRSPSAATEYARHWRLAASPGATLIYADLGSSFSFPEADEDIFFVRLETPDCNANGIPDAEEIAAGRLGDCDHNALADLCDIAAGLQSDCNGDGVPDACQLAGRTLHDCDSDGIPDECAIASGLAGDCDGNGVPDRCQFGPRADADCDGNGLPDICDIAAGRLVDGNRDWVPDQCQCAADLNSDHLVTVQDLLIFLAAYLSGDPYAADFNHDWRTDESDLFGFLTAYFTGCR